MTDGNTNNMDEINGDVYDATPVNSDEESVTNQTECTALSDEEGFLSEDSDLEQQFGGNVGNNISTASNENLLANASVSTSSEFDDSSDSLREVKVNIHCGDIMYPFHKGALISSQNGKMAEVILHGDFGGKYYDENTNTTEKSSMVALVKDSKEQNNEQEDVDTIFEVAEM